MAHTRLAMRWGISLALFLLTVGCEAAAVSGESPAIGVSAAGIVVAQNDTTRVPVVLERRGGYGGPVQVVFTGLPDGVVVLGSSIPAGGAEFIAIVVASTRADTGVRDVTISASAPGVSAATATVSLRVLPSGFDVTLRDQAAFAVARGNTTTLRYDLNRFGAFRGPVSVDIADLPDGIAVMGTGDIPAGGQPEPIRISVLPQARRGEIPLMLVAKSSEYPEERIPLTLTVLGIDSLIVSAVAQPVVTQRGEVEIPVFVSRSVGFPEPVELLTGGLPPGISVRFFPAIIPPTVSQATLVVSATEAAPIGTTLISVLGRTVVPAQVNVGRTIPVEVAVRRVASLSMELANGSSMGNSGSLLEGSSEVLNTTMRDVSGNPITWRVPSYSVSNPSVLALSADGVVQARAPGTAEITATIDSIVRRLSVTVYPDLHLSTWRGTWSFSETVGTSQAAWLHTFLPTSMYDATYTRRTANWRDGYTVRMRITGDQQVEPRTSYTQQYMGSSTVTYDGNAGIDGNFSGLFSSCGFRCWNITPNIYWVWASNFGYRASLGGMDVTVNLVNVSGPVASPSRSVRITAERVP